MKILVTKFRLIGDVLLSTPVFASLKEIYPDAELHVSVNDFCTQIITDNPHVDKVIPYYRANQSDKSLWQKITHEIKFYRQFIGQYDLIINLTEGDRGCIISAISGAHRRMGYIKKPTVISRLARFDTTIKSLQPIPTVQKDLQFIETINPLKVVKKVSMGWRKAHEDSVNMLLAGLGLDSNFVLVHPASRSLHKCWDTDKVASCIDHIQKKWHTPVLLTTSSDSTEVAMANEISDYCKQKPHQLPHSISLQEYGYLTSRASLFFGVDSAPMHIAAATNTPVIALFGASDPSVWGPWDNNEGCNYKNTAGAQYNGQHTVISNDHPETGMSLISLDLAIEAIDNALIKQQTREQP